MSFSGNNPASRAYTPSIIMESPQTCSKPRCPTGGFRFRTGFVGNEHRSWQGDVFTLHWAPCFRIKGDYPPPAIRENPSPEPLGERPAENAGTDVREAVWQPWLRGASLSPSDDSAWDGELSWRCLILGCCNLSSNFFSHLRMPDLSLCSGAVCFPFVLIFPFSGWTRSEFLFS